MKKLFIPLFEGIGKSEIEHFAMVTAFGKLPEAKELFHKLGWEEVEERKTSGDWGTAIFLSKPGSTLIQLTGPSSIQSLPNAENHLALFVDDPLSVAFQIKEWAKIKNARVDWERLSDDKYFVSMPDILTVCLELISTPGICPKCHGRGKVRRGQEGKGYDYDCVPCKGTGKIQKTEGEDNG